MHQEHPDPTLLQNLATGYWNSATLLAANQLDLFGALGQASRSVSELAQQFNAPERSLTMLLDACVGLGLLTKEREEEEVRYANAPISAAYLVPGSPGYLGGALRWSADQYPLWGRLADAVRAGTPAAAPELHLGADPERTRRFVLGMHQRALGMARGVLPFLDFEGVLNLLDIGGGPGTYASLLAQKYPELRATVFDLPAIVAVAEELIAEAGVAERVQIRPGDAVRDSFGEAECDGVLCSGVLHQMSGATIQNVLAKAYRALQPGGRIVICDLMLDATKTHPPFETLFSLQMLLTSEEGAVFSEEECQRWLEEAGFTNVQRQRLPPFLPYVVVAARK